MTKVLVFGTFDGIHDGHRYFLTEARKRGDLLAVIVAHDATVLQLKGHPVRTVLAQRMATLAEERLADEIIAGDETLGSWNSVANAAPDIICLGYDQEALREALAAYKEKTGASFAIETIGSVRPDELHSSLLFG